VPTIRGPIVSESRSELAGYSFEVTIPADRRARVLLLQVDFRVSLQGPPDAVAAVIAGGHATDAVSELASGGTYRFRGEARARRLANELH